MQIVIPVLVPRLNNLGMRPQEWSSLDRSYTLYANEQHVLSQLSL